MFFNFNFIVNECFLISLSIRKSPLLRDIQEHTIPIIRNSVLAKSQRYFLSVEFPWYFLGERSGNVFSIKEKLMGHTHAVLI